MRTAYTPEQLQAAKEKKLAAVKRAQQKLRDKHADPEYRAACYASASERKRLNWEKSKSKVRKVTSKRKKSSKGMLGRTPTSKERKIMSAIGALPCIACNLHGKITDIVTLHHISGRVAPDAHMRVLPLCDHHHQHAAPKEVRDQYPWLVPLHACGKIGGKAQFIIMNATEDELLAQTYKLANIITETQN